MPYHGRQQHELGVTIVTTDKQNFDEAPQMTNRTDKEGSMEDVDTMTEDEMAEELALQEAGSAAAVPEQESDEGSDEISTGGTPFEPHAMTDPTATGPIFSTFGVLPSTNPARRTQLRSGTEEAYWFNQFRERLTQSYQAPPSGEVKTFGMTEAAEVPLHQPIAEGDDTDNPDTSTNHSADVTKAYTDASANSTTAGTTDDTELTAAVEQIADDDTTQTE